MLRLRNQLCIVTAVAVDSIDVVVAEDSIADTAAVVVACLHSHSKVADAAAAAVAVPIVALSPLDAATSVVGSRDS